MSKKADTVVWGYKLTPPPNTLPQSLILPKGAKLRSALADRFYIKVYAEVNPSVDGEDEFEIGVWGTGYYFHSNGFTYLDTVQIPYGEVYHIYYRKLS